MTRNKSEKYWSDRAARRMHYYQAQADQIADDIADAYIKAKAYIDAEVQKIFAGFETKTGLSEKSAKRILKKLNAGKVKYLKELAFTISDPDAKQTILDMISSPAYSFRIRRLEQLLQNIDKLTSSLAGDELNTTKQHYITLTSEAYNRTVFDIQKGTGIGFSFSQLPASRIIEILDNNWSGKLFSERIWGNADDLNTKIKQELLTGFMTGRSYKKTAAAIQDQLAVGAMEARRLVRTESTYIANMAELESYNQCGISQYKYVATLDARTSAVCRALDGKLFDTADGVPGVNLPPLHPWCRSTTIAVIDGAVLDSLQRRARDPITGKNYLVSADMTYEDWKKSIDARYGAGTMEREMKKTRNYRKDKAQYSKFKKVLGKDNLPKGFDAFQNLKYSNIEAWQDLKYYYRNIGDRDIKYVKIDRELDKFGINKGKAYPADNELTINSWTVHAEGRLKAAGVRKDVADRWKSEAQVMLKRHPAPNTLLNFYHKEGIIGIREADLQVRTIIDEKRFKNETRKILEVIDKYVKGS